MNHDRLRAKLMGKSPEAIANDRELQAELDLVLDHPCPRGFSSWLAPLPKSDPVLFGSLPPWMRPHAQAKLNQLIRRTIARGQPITQQKFGSLVGNATWITRDITCSRRYWGGQMGKKFVQARMQWRLREKREKVRKILALCAFRERNPIRTRNILGAI
jgi:hypothetical protein